MPADPTILEELRVTSPSEIATYLQELLRANASVLLSGPQGHSLAARVCAFSPEADLFGLEVGADPEGVSQALVAGGEITGVAYLGTIRLQFEFDSAVIVSGDRGAVLRSAVPLRLYRFQRRQAFRVQPAGTLFPRIVLPGAAPDTPGRTLRVLDISVGGLALALPADFDPLPPGHIANGLTLELDRTTGLRVTLLPHHISPIEGDPQGTRQLGCAFVELDTGAGRALQVYVDQTQKRRRLLRLDA
jgi:c-di-GMP-binding flagellar brake protein YcgR